MDAKGIWIATSKHSKLHQVYKIAMKIDIRNEFIEILNLNRHFSQLEKRLTDIPEKNPKSLIEGDEYYLENKDNIIETENIIELYKVIIDNEELQKQKTQTFKKTTQEYDEKERERFYIILVENNNKEYYLFMYVNSREIVRKRKFLDPGLSLNKNSTIIDVAHGIPIPEEITATFSFEQDKLFVHKVYQFERMLYLYEAYQEKASDQIEGFKKGTNKVGKDLYTVKGLEDQSVSQTILSKVRYTKRLADFDNQPSNYPIKHIENAVNQLPNEDRVEFCHNTKSIIVKKENVKTFVGIVHDSIVKRLISREIEVI